MKPRGRPKKGMYPINGVNDNPFPPRHLDTLPQIEPPMTLCWEVRALDSEMLKGPKPQHMTVEACA